MWKNERESQHARRDETRRFSTGHARNEAGCFGACYAGAYDAHWNVQDKILRLPRPNHPRSYSLTSHTNLVPLHTYNPLSIIHPPDFSRYNICLRRMALPERVNARVEKSTARHDDAYRHSHLCGFLFFSRHRLRSCRKGLLLGTRHAYRRDASRALDRSAKRSGRLKSVGGA